MAPHWKPLKSNTFKSETPPLLVKYEFGLLNYNIYLSDLTSIWVESLERRQIVKRALNVDTIIDPSESSDQLQLLLQNIQKALDGMEGATLSLSKAGTTQQLILRTTTPLPGALKPLVWPIHLLLARQHLLTTELLQPCLSQQFFAKAQIVSLIQLIKDKDHVITRLTEKMQSDGTDLTKIFPGASILRSGAKSHFRESASKFVRGLGEFDDGQWRKDFFERIHLPSNLHDVLLQVFSGLENSSDLNFENIGGAWWQNLRNEDPQDSNGSSSSALASSERVHGAAHTPRLAEDGGANVTDFQQQTTSADTRKRIDNRMTPPITFSRKAQKKSDSEDTTADNSDGDLDSSVFNQNARKNSFQPSPDKISRSSMEVDAENGTFEAEGSRKPEIKPDIIKGGPTEPHQVKPDAKKKATLVSKVVSGESQDPDHKHVPKSKSRLGKIGGRGKPEKASDLSEPNDLPTEPQSISLRGRSQITTLDTEGKPSHTIPTNPNPLRKGGAGLPRGSPSPQRGTSQAHANSRREQLKRGLEKNGMTPAKKKRKF